MSLSDLSTGVSRLALPLSLFTLTAVLLGPAGAHAANGFGMSGGMKPGGFAGVGMMKPNFAGRNRPGPGGMGMMNPNLAGMLNAGFNGVRKPNFAGRNKPTGQINGMGRNMGLEEGCNGAK